MSNPEQSCSAIIATMTSRQRCMKGWSQRPRRGGILIGRFGDSFVTRRSRRGRATRGRGSDGAHRRIPAGGQPDYRLHFSGGGSEVLPPREGGRGSQGNEASQRQIARLPNSSCRIPRASSYATADNALDSTAVTLTSNLQDRLSSETEYHGNVVK